MQIKRARQMRRGVLHFSPWHVREVEAAVEQHETGTRKFARECVRVDERGEMVHAAFYNPDQS
jgi:hypothetical protein